MVRVVSVLALMTAMLCACKAPPSKTEQAAASSAPAPASSAPAAPPEPAHNWAYRQGEDYAYLTGTAPVGEQEQPTLVRYLGVQDGVYTIVETQQGAVVGASCAKPCDKVRLRGKGLDQTLALNPGSTVFAALSDAMNGQLEVYKVKGASGPTAPPQ